MNRFCVTAAFPAAHRIRLDSSGTLEPVHVHVWRVRAWMCAEPPIEETAERAREFVAAWARRHRGRSFNDLEPFDVVNPTAEEVARVLAEALEDNLADVEVDEVCIGEAHGFSASYRSRGPRDHSA